MFVKNDKHESCVNFDLLGNFYVVHSSRFENIYQYWVLFWNPQTNKSTIYPRCIYPATGLATSQADLAGSSYFKTYGIIANNSLCTALLIAMKAYP